MSDYSEDQQKPLVPGGSSCVTAKLMDCRDGTFRFKPAAALYFVPVFLFVMACFFLILPNFSVPSAHIVFYIGSGICLVGGLLVIHAYRKQAVFDFNRKCYWKDSRKLRMGENPERMKDYLSFKNIESLQIITERCKGSKGATWFSYELNIVCHNGTRYNVIDHGGLEQIRKDGRQLADMLGVPLHEVKYRSENSKKKADNVKALLIVSCVTSVIALIMIFGMILYPAIKYWQVQSWAATPAVIKQCYLDQYTTRSKHGRQTHYYVNITYTYTRNGQTYQGNNFDVGGSRSSTKSRSIMRAMQRIIRHLPPGRQVVCYVNPSNPADSLLLRELPLAYLLDCLSCIFFSILPIVFFSLYFLAKRKKKRLKAEAQAADL